MSDKAAVTLCIAELKCLSCRAIFLRPKGRASQLHPLIVLSFSLSFSLAFSVPVLAPLARMFPVCCVFLVAPCRRHDSGHEHETPRGITCNALPYLPLPSPFLPGNHIALKTCSVAFNSMTPTSLEDMVCYSGNGKLYVRTGSFPVQEQAR